MSDIDPRRPSTLWKPKIQVVRQKDTSGCAIACAAMMSGKTYDEVRERYLACVVGANEFSLKAFGNGAGLTSGQMLDLLSAVECTAQVVEAPVIVSVEREYGRHYIVVDESGNIMDPGLEADENE